MLSYAAAAAQQRQALAAALEESRSEPAATRAAGVAPLSAAGAPPLNPPGGPLTRGAAARAAAAAAHCTLPAMARRDYVYLSTYADDRAAALAASELAAGLSRAGLARHPARRGCGSELRRRELGAWPPGARGSMTTRLRAAMLPTRCISESVGQHLGFANDGALYNVLWADDGGMLFTSGQDEFICVYDTAELRPASSSSAQQRGGAPGVAGLARIEAEGVSWTITSIDVDQAGSKLIYSTMNPTVHLVGLRELRERQAVARAAAQPLPDDGDDAGGEAGDVDAGGGGGDGSGGAASGRTRSAAATGADQRRAPTRASGGRRLPPTAPRPVRLGRDVAHERIDVSDGGAHPQRRVYQVKYGAAGSELVAGCSDNSLVVVDLETARLTCTLAAHQRDINAIAWLDDRAHSNVLLSGGDDTTVRIWDRRTMGAGGPPSSPGSGAGHATAARPEGYLLGHTEGITSLSSRNDGTYVCSNGKDWCCKLWDVRKAAAHSEVCGSSSAAARLPPALLSSRSGYDYRWQGWPHAMERPDARSEPATDRSVMTFRGHVVAKTLIRAHFTPPESTGGAYIITGSADGHVSVYDVLSGEGDAVASVDVGQNVVREARWHPRLPVIAAGGFTGALSLFGYGGGAPAEEGGEGASSSRQSRQSRLLWRTAVQAEAARTQGAGAGAGDAAAAAASRGGPSRRPQPPALLGPGGYHAGAVATAALARYPALQRAAGDSSTAAGLLFAALGGGADFDDEEEEEDDDNEDEWRDVDDEVDVQAALARWIASRANAEELAPGNVDGAIGDVER